LYLLDGDRIVHLLSWHQVQTEEQLGEALREVKEARLLPAEKVRLCVVADGAEWIWKHVQAFFPQACQVLDYYHCAQDIHKVAKAQYGASLQGLEWAEATMTRLYLGNVSAVLGGLRRMQPTSDEAAQAIANGWEYLNEHRERTRYRQFRRGGYPLGSGGIESSNKFICHVRLKRSGAWWYEINEVDHRAAVVAPQVLDAPPPQVVENGHAHAVLDQRLHQRAADEAGAAGDDRARAGAEVCGGVAHSNGLGRAQEGRRGPRSGGPTA
jgi:hypothetical protein